MKIVRQCNAATTVGNSVGAGVYKIKVNITVVAAVSQNCFQIHKTDGKYLLAKCENE